MQIKVQTIPYDDHDIDTALSELAEKGLIVRYNVEGKKYIQIKNFEKHQHCHIREPESTIPAPCKTGARPVRKRQEGKGTIKEGKGREQGEEKPSPGFVLPDWIPSEVWRAFLEIRKEKRAKATDYAHTLIILELEKIKKEHGHDPTEVLNKSIKAGWSDVYPLKGDRKNGTNIGSSQAVTPEIDKYTGIKTTVVECD